jgi:hypothetical protein
MAQLDVSSRQAWTCIEQPPAGLTAHISHCVETMPPTSQVTWQSIAQSPAQRHDSRFMKSPPLVGPQRVSGAAPLRTAPHGLHAGTPSPLLTTLVPLASSEEKVKPPVPPVPPAPDVIVDAESSTTFPPHAASEAAHIELIQNHGRIVPRS